MYVLSAKISQIQAQATSAAQQKQEAAATNSAAAAAAAATLAAGAAAASATTEVDQAMETEAKKEEVGILGGGGFSVWSPSTIGTNSPITFCV